MEVKMSSIDVSPQAATKRSGAGTVAMKLEGVNLPVADVDRTKGFCEQLGWRLDGDFTVTDGYRVVQYAPTGSDCAITFGEGVTTAEPGSLKDVLFVVADIEEARADLIERGVDVSEVWHDETGVFHHAAHEARVPGPDPQGRSYSTWASVSDPH